MGELDRRAFLWVVEHRVEWLDPMFVGLSLLGTAGLVWIAMAPLAAFLGKRPPIRAFALTAATVWGADLTAQGLKAVFDRPRPSQVLPQADPLVAATVGSSFPSGHAATSAAGLICLWLLLPKALPALAVLAAGIACSRIYVGVHYPGDVLGGLAVGTAFGLALRAFTGGRRHPRPPAGGAGWQEMRVRRRRR